MMLAVAFIFIGITSTFANVAKTEKVKVYGSCGQCKTRIENAAKSVQGVTKATWTQKDEMLTVTFDDTKTTLLKIEEAIVRVGHDTGKLKADDKTYMALPDCCHYRK